MLLAGLLSPSPDLSSEAQQDEFVLLASTDPEGALLEWERNPPETRGIRMLRGAAADNIRPFGSSHWHRDYTGTIPTRRVDLNAEPGQEYFYQIQLLDADRMVIATSGIASAVGVENGRSQRRPRRQFQLRRRQFRRRRLQFQLRPLQFQLLRLPSRRRPSRYRQLLQYRRQSRQPLRSYPLPLLYEIETTMTTIPSRSSNRYR